MVTVRWTAQIGSVLIEHLSEFPSEREAELHCRQLLDEGAAVAAGIDREGLAVVGNKKLVRASRLSFVEEHMIRRLRGRKERPIHE